MAATVGEELDIQGIQLVGGERAFASDADVIHVSDWGDADDEVKTHP